MLVAILVASIGILGFASLQFLGLNSNQAAYYRSQASFIATDLSERMRSNIDGMNANAYANFNSSTITCDNTNIPTNFCDERNSSGTVMTASSCDATQRAAHDLFVITCGYSNNEYTAAEKNSFIGDLLPGANVRVQCNDSVTTDADACTDFSDHTITVSWSEANEGADADGKLLMSAPTV